MANMLDHAGRRLLSSGQRFDHLGQTQNHPRLTGTVTVGMAIRVAKFRK
jgi:hypothetical protein